MTILLKKDGLWLREWEERKWQSCPMSLHPEDFFPHWNDPFEIKGRVTLQNLVDNVLLKLHPQTRLIVDSITDANLEDYLRPEQLVPKRERKCEVKGIEVYKTFELSNFREVKEWDFEEGNVSAHGLGKGEEGPFAIEFDPWAHLLHLPLSLQTTAKLCTSTFKKCRPKKLIKGWGLTSDRESVSYENQEIFVSFTLGEFFCGLFNELCFFSCPSRRNAQKANLMATIEELEEKEE